MENARIVAALKANRRDRIFGYGLIAIGTMFSLFVSGQSSALSSALPELARLLFVFVFFASAMLCFAGALLDWWIFEYVGLLPLLGSFSIYGLSIVAFGLYTAGMVVIPTGACMLGFALLFRARRTDLAVIYNHELSERKH